jgi:hypothetical protein
MEAGLIACCTLNLGPSANARLQGRGNVVGRPFSRLRHMVIPMVLPIAVLNKWTHCLTRNLAEREPLPHLKIYPKRGWLRPFWGRTTGRMRVTMDPGADLHALRPYVLPLFPRSLFLHPAGLHHGTGVLPRVPPRNRAIPPVSDSWRREPPRKPTEADYHTVTHPPRVECLLPNQAERRNWPRNGTVDPARRSQNDHQTGNRG